MERGIQIRGIATGGITVASEVHIPSSPSDSRSSPPTASRSTADPSDEYMTETSAAKPSTPIHDDRTNCLYPRATGIKPGHLYILHKAARMHWQTKIQARGMTSGDWQALKDELEAYGFSNPTKLRAADDEFRKSKNRATKRRNHKKKKRMAAEEELRNSSPSEHEPRQAGSQHPEKQHPEKQHPEKQHPEKQHPEKQHPEKQHPEKQHPEKQHPENQYPEKQHPENQYPEKQYPEKYLDPYPNPQPDHDLGQHQLKPVTSGTNDIPLGRNRGFR